MLLLARAGLVRALRERRKLPVNELIPQSQRDVPELLLRIKDGAVFRRGFCNQMTQFAGFAFRQESGNPLPRVLGARAQPQLSDFDEDDLYAAMDELTGRWVGLEKQLYQQAFPTGVSLVL